MIPNQRPWDILRSVVGLRKPICSGEAVGSGDHVATHWTLTSSNAQGLRGTCGGREKPHRERSLPSNFGPAELVARDQRSVDTLKVPRPFSVADGRPLPFLPPHPQAKPPRAMPKSFLSVESGSADLKQEASDPSTPPPRPAWTSLSRFCESGLRRVWTTGGGQLDRGQFCEWSL